MTDFNENVEDEFDKEPSEDDIIENVEDVSLGEGNTPIMGNSNMKSNVQSEVRFEGDSQHKWSGSHGCSAYIDSAAHIALVNFKNAQEAQHPDLYFSMANYTTADAHISQHRRNGRRKCYGVVTAHCYIIFTTTPTG